MGLADVYATLSTRSFFAVKIIQSVSTDTVRMGKIGQTHAVEPLAHRQRVNVLGSKFTINFG